MSKKLAKLNHSINWKLKGKIFIEIGSNYK